VKGDWEHLKQMKGHKGSVNSLAVHPSGRLALSVAHDRALRMWDLVKGRCTYTAKLDAEGDNLQFCPSGEVGSQQ
jgi:WD40 repeat protein